MINVVPGKNGEEKVRSICTHTHTHTHTRTPTHTHIPIRIYLDHSKQVAQIDLYNYWYFSL